MTNFSKVDNNIMKIPYELFASSEDGFITTRTALKTLLSKEGLPITDLKVELSLHNHREIPKYPQYFTSLSHTRGMGAAALIKRDLVLGVGIDVEWSDRIIKPGMEKFFVNELDQTNLKPIELWTVKEAAFKTLSPIGTFPGTLVLSKIIIHGNRFFTNEEPHLKGTFHIHHHQIAGRNLVVTLASV
jgi:hypothetical protein